MSQCQAEIAGREEDKIVTMTQIRRCCSLTEDSGKLLQAGKLDTNDNLNKCQLMAGLIKVI